MMNLDTLFSTPQFTLDAARKRSLLLSHLRELTDWHRRHCSAYANVVDRLDLPATPLMLEDLPYLPVRLFKTRRLQSIADADLFKLLTSSGTTSQTPSQIVLDKETAQLQSRALTTIMTSFLGKQRLPMLIADSASVVGSRGAHSARAAGILGMATFGRDHFYALDERMDLRADELTDWLDAHRGRPLFVFGFTFMVWQYLIERLRQRGIAIDAHDGVLVHGGGWKTLGERAVDRAAYQRAAREVLGVARVHDYYGMVEQVGSVYVECEHGFLHAPNYAEVIVRDYHRWQPCPIGQLGVLQTLSVLPRSYPGHSLLTEDLAVVRGVDDCPCGRLGSRFSVLGRIPQAELRGCSDTHAQSVREDT
jgi:phenylacetate-coenzyme A ligase PaaK-like adenylate-forming protein